MANLFGTIGDQVGVSFSSINLNVIFSFMGQLVTGLLIIIILAGIIGLLLYKLKQKKLFNKQGQFWEEVDGSAKETDLYKMAEIVIPNSGMRVFYIRELDLYLPRSTRKVGFRKFWYFIRRNREIINFAPKSLDDEMKELNLDYDHTDMRYANENLKELINRNFRQKAVKWWQEYKEIISLVLIIFAFTFGAFFLLGKMSDLLGQMGSMFEQQKEMLQISKEYLELARSQAQGSGIILNG